MRFGCWIGMAGVAALLAGCSSSYGTGPGPSSGPSGGTPSTGSTTQITVASNYFQPQTDTVAAGTTITWTWAEGYVNHNVTFQDGPSSPTQASGSYQRTFPTAGTYPYRCTIHSSNFTTGMVGTIVVR